MLPHRNIHKYSFTWTYNGKTHHEIDHVLRNKRKHSNVIDVRSLMSVVVTIISRLQKLHAVNKGAAQRFDTDLN